MKYEAQQLVKVIDFWQGVAKKGGIHNRDITTSIDTRTKEVIDIIGVRRGGKSSILKLIIERLGLTNDFLYINFEDPFFVDNNHVTVIEGLIDTYKEYFNGGLRYLFFDEIQVIDNWEKAVRKLRDSEEFKIYVTGSSAKLLSGELATLLSGRHLSYRLMPLSFAEYLQFKGVELKDRKDLILHNVQLLKHFDDHLYIGGFPEVVATGSKELLKQYFFDIIQKDIVMRHSLREPGILEKMAIFLMTNSAKTTSVESLKKAFDVSYQMAAAYIDYFKESFLFFEVPQFSYSLKTQQKAIKKYYAVDCGLAGATAIRFSEDKGRILENCVYLHLQQLYKEVYYYRTKSNLEVDFFTRSDQQDSAAIQVAWSLKDEKTKDREIRALATTLDETKLSEGLILTYDEEDNFVIDGKTIIVKPVYLWLLEGDRGQTPFPLMPKNSRNYR